MATQLRFATDDDVLAFEPGIEDWFPRHNKKTGATIRSWDVQHQLAMNEIDRRLRNHKSTIDMFEVGRIGFRSRENLREAAACFALHHMFVACDTLSNEPQSFFSRKAAHYWERANSIFAAEVLNLDYDSDRDGTVQKNEEQQSFVARVIRG